MATASPLMKKTVTTVRRNIRLSRESGYLAIPAETRVSVVGSPCTVSSTIDITIRDVPDAWVLTRDASGNQSVTPEARTVARQLVKIVRDEGNDTFGCFVYAHGVILGSWLRR